MKRFFLFFVLLWIFVSCGKSDNQQDNRLYDNWKYTGSFSIYSVGGA